MTDECKSRGRSIAIINSALTARKCLSTDVDRPETLSLWLGNTFLPSLPSRRRVALKMMFQRDQFEREVTTRLAEDDDEGAEYRYRSQAYFQQEGAQRFDPQFVLPLLGARDANDVPGKGEGLSTSRAFKIWVKNESSQNEAASSTTARKP